MSLLKFIPYIIDKGEIQIYKVAKNSEHSDELIKNAIATQEKVDPNVISFHPTCHTREEAWSYFLNNNFLFDNNTVGKAIAKKVKERIDEKGEVPDSVKVYVKVSVEFQIDKEMISPIRERGRPWYWYIDSNSVLATAAGGALVGNALGSGAGAVIGGSSAVLSEPQRGRARNVKTAIPCYWALYWYRIQSPKI